jgi:SAM-dependent methyltransferase
MKLKHLCDDCTGEKCTYLYDGSRPIYSCDKYTAPNARARNGESNMRRYNSALSIQYHHILDLLPDHLGKSTILDVGFGEGYNGYLIRTVLEGTPNIHGIDIDQKMVDIQRPLNIYDYIVKVDARHFIEDMGFYDYILATAFIEHLEKEDSIKVIEKLMKKTLKRFIVYAPLNEKISKSENNPYRGNIYNNHLSSWSSGDLRDLGFTYRVYDSRKMSKTTRIFDNIRRSLFVPWRTLKYIIGWYDNE